MSNTRAEIRQSIRKKRNSLTVEQQKNAAIALKVNFTQHLKSLKTPKRPLKPLKSRIWDF